MGGVECREYVDSCDLHLPVALILTASAQERGEPITTKAKEEKNGMGGEPHLLSYAVEDFNFLSPTWNHYDQNKQSPDSEGNLVGLISGCPLLR